MTPMGRTGRLFTLYGNTNDLRSDFKDAAGADQGWRVSQAETRSPILGPW